MTVPSEFSRKGLSFSSSYRSCNTRSLSRNSLTRPSTSPAAPLPAPPCDAGADGPPEEQADRDRLSTTTETAAARPRTILPRFITASNTAYSSRTATATRTRGLSGVESSHRTGPRSRHSATSRGTTRFPDPVPAAPTGFTTRCRAPSRVPEEILWTCPTRLCGPPTIIRGACLEQCALGCVFC